MTSDQGTRSASAPSTGERTPAARGRFAKLLRKHRWLRPLLRDKGFWLGGSTVFGITLVALCAPLLTPHDPTWMEPMNRLKAPSWEHPFGTDNSGRDVFSMVIFGSRISLIVGAAVMLLSSVAGIGLGLAAGHSRTLDNLIMRLNDGLMAFPAIVLAIALMAALGPGVLNIIVALSVVDTPRMARIVRSVALSVKELDFVEAARAMGASNATVAFRHILPQCIPPIIVQGTFVFAFAVLAEASLSFLGVGAPPYIPSWGNIISTGRLYMIDAPWISLFPGITILAMILALNLLGDALRDSFDPRMQKIVGPA